MRSYGTRKEDPMAAKKKKASRKVAKSLSPKGLTSKQARGVKGGTSQRLNWQVKVNG